MLGKYRRVLVTGGAGFIGSHICDELVNLNKQVIIIDDLSTGKQENIPKGTEFIQLDIANLERLRDVFQNVDVVFHVAAQPSSRKSVKNQNLDFSSNVIGTFNMLMVAVEKNVKRLSTLLLVEVITSRPVP